MISLDLSKQNRASVACGKGLFCFPVELALGLTQESLDSIRQLFSQANNSRSCSSSVVSAGFIGALRKRSLQIRCQQSSPWCSLSSELFLWCRRARVVRQARQLLN